MHDGLVAAADVSRRTLQAAVKSGQLVRVVPGLYAAADAPLGVRCRALCRHDPRAVIVGRASAALTWWPELNVPTIEAARTWHPSPVRGFTWSRQRVPADHVAVVRGVRLTTPSYTAVDLLPDLGGEAIDQALRRRAATLAEMNDAMAAMADRPGNALRRALLHDSRDQPWSEAERAFHRRLRRSRLPEKFETNYPVRLEGRLAHLDAALPRLRLGFEIDGYAFHGGPAAFAAGCERGLRLARHRWRLHHFAAAMVFDRPDWVIDTVEALVRCAQTQRQ